MTDQELSEKREKLNTYLGQLIDLEEDIIDELIITQKSDVKLLKGIIVVAIANIDLELKKQQND